MTLRPLRILHVTEAFGGGVVTSIDEMVSRLPEFEHHLLRSLREADYHDGDGVDRFTTVTELPRGPASVRTLRRVVHDLQPDVVHAHSSYAGVSVRLGLASRSTRIVYTPHGFGFLRLDVSPARRRAIEQFERLLTWNTTAIAACSVHEASLATFGRSRTERYVIPNVVSTLEGVTRSAPEPGLIVAVGRLAPIRDPEYFARTVDEVRRTAPAVRACWVGGGSDEYRELLERNGVEVTGWVSRREVLEHVSRAAAYVHTSAWDGFPMSVLEAVALGVPTFARRTVQLEECPPEVLFDSSDALGAAVAAEVTSPTAPDDHDRIWSAFLHEHSPEVQRARLLDAYGVAPDVDRTPTGEPSLS